jgi:hypothetical protein
MKHSLAVLTMAVPTALHGVAGAQDTKTRGRVRADLADAFRTGDIVASGDSDRTLRELSPHRYPAGQAAPEKTHAKVVAELQEARSNVDFPLGNTGLTERDVFPDKFPPKVAAKAKTREQVRAELAEVIRTGNIAGLGGVGLTLHNQYPQHYTPMAVPSTKYLRQTPAAFLAHPHFH